MSIIFIIGGAAVAAGIAEAGQNIIEATNKHINNIKRKKEARAMRNRHYIDVIYY